jgi:hypothetical protein
VLRRNGVKLRLREASRTAVVPMPTFASRRRVSARMIESAMPIDVIAKTRGSKKSPPRAW